MMNLQAGNLVQCQAQEQASERVADQPNRLIGLREQAEPVTEAANDPGKHLESRRVSKEAGMVTGSPQCRSQSKERKGGAAQAMNEQDEHGRVVIQTKPRWPSWPSC